ncbi:hypothetical protein [Lapillicoccus jejuensis]|uniref:Ig-like domain-containing protein n=1 Tax=Lapillicoccus jejuensis TaxID=402171 RepID=A0A542DYE6_9MICO|nr:hypothetical protein [Lapillicoccus jejuensis]TQJ08066.1 hypothetical protein FB458_1145 [Lapillicoccus jejuensis]
MPSSPLTALRSLHPRSRTRLSRRLALGSLLTAGALALGAAPAHAVTDVPDSGTSALVTRLTVDDGRGWLTVQVRVQATSVVGFEVHVPAGTDETWTGSPDVDVRELGIHCRSVGVRNLAYVCGDRSGAADAPSLPSGGYQVTLPVTHTGVLPAGVFGHTWVDARDATGQVGRYGGDAFPVVDGSHYYSTAELRTAPLVADPDTVLSGTATVPISMTVVPGEEIASVDVSLPGSGPWTQIGTNAPARGASCGVVQPVAGANRVLHCTGEHGGPLPVGRYQLVSTLRWAGPDVDGHWTQVKLTAVGGVAQRMDTCHFRFATTV